MQPKIFVEVGEFFIILMASMFGAVIIENSAQRHFGARKKMIIVSEAALQLWLERLDEGLLYNIKVL